MATPIITNQTTNGASPGVQCTGPCTVFTKDVFDGATVTPQIAATDTPADYALPPGGKPDRLAAPGSINIIAYGTYWLRLVVQDAGPGTSVSGEMSQ